MFGNELFGWLGGIAFAVCGIPQSYKSYIDGNSNGLAFSFILLWLLGELFTIIYILPTGSLPLYFNYGGNLIFVLIILKYKIWPRKRS